MLYEHSGRLGFKNVQAKRSVPNPEKWQLCAMLRRETELRNSAPTQRLLDTLHFPEAVVGTSSRVHTLEEAKETIAALRGEIAMLRVQGYGCVRI